MLVIVHVVDRLVLCGNIIRYLLFILVFLFLTLFLFFAPQETKVVSLLEHL